MSTWFALATRCEVKLRTSNRATMFVASGHALVMKTIPTQAGPVDIWHTPEGWRFSPVLHNEPEDFSDVYRDEAEVTEQVHVWASEVGEDEPEDEGWLE